MGSRFMSGYEIFSLKGVRLLESLCLESVIALRSLKVLWQLESIEYVEQWRAHRNRFNFNLYNYRLYNRLH